GGMLKGDLYVFALKRFYEPCYQRCAWSQIINQDVFVLGMGAVTIRAKSVKDGRPERSNKIPVTTPACSSLSKFKSDLPCQTPSMLVESAYCLRSFQGRPVHFSNHLYLG